MQREDLYKKDIWDFLNKRSIEKQGEDYYEDGEIVTNNDCYLASTWATPELEINGGTIECFVYQKDKPEWDAGTMWCESALSILNSVE